MANNTILVGGGPRRRSAILEGSTIKAGHFVELTAGNKVKKNTLKTLSTGGFGKLIVYEDLNSINHEYPVGDTVTYANLYSGCVVLAMVKTSHNALSRGDVLMHDGAGVLAKATGNGVGIVVVLEASPKVDGEERLVKVEVL